MIIDRRKKGNWIQALSFFLPTTTPIKQHGCLNANIQHTRRLHLFTVVSSACSSWYSIAALFKRPTQSHIGYICTTPPGWPIKHCFQKAPEQRYKAEDPAGPLADSPNCYAFKRPLADDMMMLSQAVEKDPLVIFMKGTPAVPQCGFSRAVIQIMDIQVSWRERLQEDALSEIGRHIDMILTLFPAQSIRAFLSRSSRHIIASKTKNYARESKSSRECSPFSSPF